MMSAGRSYPYSVLTAEARVLVFLSVERTAIESKCLPQIAVPYWLYRDGILGRSICRKRSL